MFSQLLSLTIASAEPRCISLVANPSLTQPGILLRVVYYTFKHTGIISSVRSSLELDLVSLLVTQTPLRISLVHLRVVRSPFSSGRLKHTLPRAQLIQDKSRQTYSSSVSHTTQGAHRFIPAFIIARERGLVISQSASTLSCRLLRSPGLESHPLGCSFLCSPQPPERVRPDMSTSPELSPPPRSSRNERGLT